MKLVTYSLLVLSAGIIVYTIFIGKYPDLWNFVTAIATVLLWVAACHELGGANRITKADFIRKFSREFFNEVTRTIVSLIEFDALVYQNISINYEEHSKTKPYPFFQIKEEIVQQLKLAPKQKEEILARKYYALYEIDDNALGHFEEIGEFEKQGLLDIKQIYDLFGYYIEIVMENCQIQKYIRDMRKEHGNDIYENAEDIYLKCKIYKETKDKKILLWWKVQKYRSDKLRLRQ